MRFLFAFAGIPNVVYGDIQAKSEQIISNKEDTFLGKALFPSGEQFLYTQQYTNLWIEDLAKRLQDDNHGALNNTAIVLIYIRHVRGDAEIQRTQQFHGRFFPALLTLGVDWVIDPKCRAATLSSKNNLVGALQRAVVSARKWLEPIEREVNQKSNRTPLLLPVKNFESKILLDHLRRLVEIEPEQEHEATLASVIAGIRGHHEKVVDEGSHRTRHFFDDRDIGFKPPGHHRHGKPWTTDGTHQRLCAISSRRRLGSPHDIHFHYDCAKNAAPFRTWFYGCHEPRVELEVEYANIAPNDHVRPVKP